jgi:hypothetical protein
VPAPPTILSLFPKGVSMASKAIDPTTTKDINKGLFVKPAFCQQKA